VEFQLQKYKVVLTWKDKFTHSYFIHGSDKSKEQHKEHLDGLRYLKKYTIKEVKFRGF